MNYSNGVSISLGDKVRLENGDIATVIVLFLNDRYVLGEDCDDGFSGRSGIEVLTESGARVVYTTPFDRDFTKLE